MYEAAGSKAAAASCGARLLSCTSFVIFVEKDVTAMKILVTGFAPFGGQPINPSWEAVKALDGAGLDCELSLVQLPVEWIAGPETLKAAVASFRPDHVLLCGQAGGRAKVSVERVGFNLCSAKAPDNAGLTRENEPILAGAPDALAATYPFEDIRAAIEEEGLPVEFSFDAGRYICNQVLWTALELARTEYCGMRAGFIHLPFLPGQKEGAPCMSLEDQQRAVHAAVRAIIAQG